MQAVRELRRRHQHDHVSAGHLRQIGGDLQSGIKRDTGQMAGILRSLRIRLDRIRIPCPKHSLTPGVQHRQSDGGPPRTRAAYPDAGERSNIGSGHDGFPRLADHAFIMRAATDGNRVGRERADRPVTLLPLSPLARWLLRGRVERPAGAGGEIQGVGLAELQAFHAGPGDHRGIVGA